MNLTESEALATLKQAQELGLLESEFEKIKLILGRTPNFTELSIFSVMWSEHCSYKNSIRWLKTLPREGARLLAKAGEENAGLIDIGNGLGCAFKIESHNHPSAIEPYQGAATGVGGIHRDIFTMGARPIAALNSLRFGNLNEEKTKHLLKGVVKGIGDYGNAFGVPTVGGEVFFDECFNTNPLVNAMSIGIVEAGKTISAISEGPGNPIYIVGSATGKDGIHGATFASGDITEDSAEKLPSVQVGDPFQEKLLLEATLEVVKTNALVGMQDMGAAGITCSTSEMSAKGQCGMNIYLDKVPTRQANMKPFEILLSESQERMLMVVKKGREKEVEEILEKWDLNCACIGEVTEGNRLKYYLNNELVADVPAEDLVLGGGAPVYEREMKEPSYLSANENFSLHSIHEPHSLIQTAETLVALPNIASKQFVYHQYDSMVGINNTSTNQPSDAAVIRILNTDKAVLAKIDCNSRYVYADAYTGAMIAVSESARNIVCSGGEPVGVTNCLNFGNPYNPEVYWQFVNAVKGMGAACEKFGTPVTGGNVSFYNQSSDDGPVFPTPAIGMLGVMDNFRNRMSLSFKNEGDQIYLFGESRNDINSSEYLANILQVKQSPPPYFNLDEEFQMQQDLKKLIGSGLLQSAHDCADGGLFTTLLESAMPLQFGFDIATDNSLRRDAFLFGESQSRVVISVTKENENAFLNMASKLGTEFSKLGAVTSGHILIDDEEWNSIQHWQNIYDHSIETILNQH